MGTREHNHRHNGHRTRQFGAVVSCTTLAAGAAVLPVWAAAPAHAGYGTRITSYEIDYTVGRDGGVDVTEKIDVAFAGSDHHGLDRFLVLAQGYNDEKHRVYPLSEVRVTSPSGAPTDVDREFDGAAERIRIGNADRTVFGRQQYQLSYHLDALVNKQSNGTTEFHWNTLGTEWTLPIDEVSVRVKGPGAVNKTTCFSGERGEKRSCEDSVTDGVAHFHATDLGHGKDLTVVAAMPTSAFTKTEPRLEDGPDAEPLGAGGPLSYSQRQLAGQIGTGLGVLAPLAVWGMGRRAYRQRGRDERFADAAPGVTPAEPDAAPTHRAEAPSTVAVRFEPPQDTTAGMMGVIIDKKADNHDVTATVVDLAVRGYLRLEQVDRDDWLFIQQPAPQHDQLLRYEADLLNNIFERGSQVRLSDLKQNFASALESAQAHMYEETVQRGWFSESPEKSRAAGRGAAVALMLLAGLIFIGGGLLNVLALPLSLGLLVAAVVAWKYSNRMGARTAVGSAIYDQSKGFEKYLQTAESDQIAFEDAERIFSRYLPYAMTLGLAKRWSALFADVARGAEAMGQPIVMPMWYVPYGGYGFDHSSWDSLNDLGTSLTDFSSAASESFAATTGSSGGSGFSGGFSGSGGGGGGGGAW